MKVDVLVRKRLFKHRHRHRGLNVARDSMQTTLKQVLILTLPLRTRLPCFCNCSLVVLLFWEANRPTPIGPSEAMPPSWRLRPYPHRAFFSMVNYQENERRMGNLYGEKPKKKRKRQPYPHRAKISMGCPPPPPHRTKLPFACTKTR